MRLALTDFVVLPVNVYLSNKDVAHGGGTVCKTKTTKTVV